MKVKVTFQLYNWNPTLLESISIRVSRETPVSDCEKFITRLYNTTKENIAYMEIEYPKIAP